MTLQTLVSRIGAAAVPIDGTDTMLTRDAVAAALKAAGFPVSAATLATKATRGGGPPYRLFGRRPLYRWGDALDWANGLLSAPAANTSEAHLAKVRDAEIGKVA
jgi:hypothetical protein